MVERLRGENETSLPDDGVMVKAMTYENFSDGLEPYPVKGKLKKLPSPFGGFQCWIGGLQVDPETVVPIDSSDNTD